MNSSSGEMAEKGGMYGCYEKLEELKAEIKLKMFPSCEVFWYIFSLFSAR